MVVGWTGLVFSLTDVVSDIVNSSNWIAGGAIISWLKGQVGHLTSSVASNSSLVQELIDEDALEPHVIWGSVGLFLVFLPGLSAAVGWILELGEVEAGGGRFSFSRAAKGLKEWGTSDWLWYLLCTFCYPAYLVTVCLGWADYQPYEAMSIEAYWEAAPQLWLNLHVFLSGSSGGLLQLLTTVLSATMIIKNSMVDQFNTFGVDLRVSISCLRFIIIVFFTFFTSIVFRLVTLALITAYLKEFAVAFLLVHFCLLLAIAWSSELRGPELVDVLHASAFMSSGNALDERGLRKQRKFLDRSNYYVTGVYTVFLITILVMMNLKRGMEHWSSLTLTTCTINHWVCPATPQWNANLMFPLMVLIGMINLVVYNKFGKHELGGEAMKEREMLEKKKRDAECGEELLLEALLIRAVRRRAEMHRASNQEQLEARATENNEIEEGTTELESFLNPTNVGLEGEKEDDFFLPSNRQEAQDMLEECRQQISQLEEKKKEAVMIEQKKERMETDIKDMDLRTQELTQEITDKEEKILKLNQSMQEMDEHLEQATARLVILEEKETKMKETLNKLESK
eukprot:TRINITY_DN33766_c0_g1_i1.p1 TRINITY_DN33766_c0_g1~~TRINITY_DN33766_c0_g1_i1.p1  ORF type:complete len:568 (-),score=150.12 TRINITY_DN33766_c0_g1_i1:193-1896(-)